ncbi:Rho GTPaseactivating protein 17like [Caligus rogercresseyi]|uniref:Rho GTPaseactivating protein 17like n=1 Tax=Caligus rogercresseyi TaxID=217165 RepID=A0A7T8KH19_CALRO|nr:Rho GTPaseactivating protein 17like [Caligus rogercresseyi]
MKKSIEKLKVRIDQNLNRAERTELLNEDLVRIEEKVIGLNNPIPSFFSCCFHGGVTQEDFNPSSISHIHSTIFIKETPEIPETRPSNP